MILLKKIDLQPIVRNRVFQLSALFLGYLVLSILWCESAQISDFLIYFRRLLYILLFIGLTIHWMRREPLFFNIFLMAFVFTAAASAIFYIAHFSVHFEFLQTRLVGNGTLRNPIRASSIYGIAVFSAIYLHEFYNKKSLKRLFAAAVVPPFMFILISQSRGPILALVLSLGSSWIFQRTFSNRVFGKKILVFLGVLFCGGIAFFLSRPDVFKFFFVERGFAYRFEIWGKILSKALPAIVFGQGLTADTNTVMADGTLFIHPHSVYVATLYYGGITGLALLIAVIGWTVKTGTANSRSPIGGLCLGSMIFGALCIATDGNVVIQHPKPFWVFFWFPIAIAAYIESMAREKSTSPLLQ
jgi:O-antigen ligase